MQHVLPAIAWGFSAVGPLLLVTLGAAIARLVPLLGQPADLAIAGAPGRAQLQFAASWLLASVTITAVGWLLLAVCLPLVSDQRAYDTAAIATTSAILPGALGLLLGFHAHARLHILLMTRGPRDGRSAGIRQLARTSGADRS